MASPAIGARPRWKPDGRPLQVDPTHPLALGLWFHRTADYPGRGAGGSSLTWAASPHGRAIQSANSTSCAYGVPIPRIGSAIADFTLHGVRAATAFDQYSSLVGLPYNPTSGSWVDPYVMAFLGTSGSNVASLGLADSGVHRYLNLSNTGFWLTDGLWHSYTGAWGVNGAITWRDGVQWETSASTPNGSTLILPTSSGAPELVFCGRSVSTVGEGWTGRQPIAIGWTRRLSAAEVAMVHDDPFCMMAR